VLVRGLEDAKKSAAMTAQIARTLYAATERAQSRAPRRATS
jgi:hypothetical protein